MKAVTFHAYGSADVLCYEEVATPRLSKGDVLVKVGAASVNPKDILIRKGHFKFLTGNKFPKRLGSDFAGVVEKTGTGAKDLESGMRVYGMLPTWRIGAYAEYVRIKAEKVALIPDQLSDTEAAALPLAGLTALQALRDLARLRAGQQVCINGASGGVGHFAIQIAKAMGAEVTAISSARNSDFCKALGADRVIDYTQEDILSSDQRFDLFFDVFGNMPYVRSRQLLEAKGIHISTIPRISNFMKAVSTVFSAQKTRVVVVKADGRDMDTLSEMVKEGKLRAEVNQTWPVDEIAEAHRYVETRRTRGKVVLEIRKRKE